jgi:uncharacterized protein
MKAVLGLTHRCNLACKYCYSGASIKKDMSLATARKIVDFVVNNSSPNEKLYFSFFGGEPLLCFDLLKEITAYIRKRTARDATCLRITTNGTMLTDSILDFIKAEKVELCISIDGPEPVHNSNRPTHDGEGSFCLVRDNLVRAVSQVKHLQVNAVFGPGTVASLPETVLFFTQLGISAIHLNPDICADWSKNARQKLRLSYMDVAKHYIESYRQGKEIAVNIIDSKIIVLLKGGYSEQDLCGMAKTQWAFAPGGNIYPCERFIGEDKNTQMTLGNIHTGVNVERRCTLLKKKGNSNLECKVCGLKEYCMNWCGCTNYHMTSRVDMAGAMLCASERAAIDAALHVFTILSEDNTLFVKHFTNYLHV